MILISGRTVSNRVITVALKTPHCAPNRLLYYTSRVNVNQYTDVSSATRMPYQIRKNYATATKKKVSAKSKSKKVVKKKAVATSKKRSLKSSTKAKASSRKIKKKPVKAPRKIAPKKELTPEQKMKRQIRKLKLDILEPPSPAPRFARTLYFAEILKNSTFSFADASAKFKTLTPAEIELYAQKAEQNKISNEEVYKKWISEYTPDQIRIANNARKLINKYLKRRAYALIQDPRQPKRPLTSYMQFTKHRFGSNEFAGLPVDEASKILGKEYRGLSSAQRKTYQDLHLEDKKRYISEYKNAFHREPKFIVKASN